MANEDSFPSLDEVASGFASAGYSPVDQAQAVLKWRDAAREQGQQALGDAPQFFQFGNNLDETVQKKLQGIQQQAFTDWGKQTFGGDEAAYTQFAQTYKQSPTQAAQINPGAAKGLSEIVANPAFQAAQPSNRFFPISMPGNPNLGNYALQKGANGNTDIFFNVQPPAVPPSPIESQYEFVTMGKDAVPTQPPVVHGMLSVPSVTDSDLEKAREEAQSQFDKNYDELQGQDSVTNLGAALGLDPAGTVAALKKNDAELQARIAVLDSPNAKGILQQERIMEAFKKSPMAKQFEKFAPGEDLARGALGVELGLNEAYQSTFGSAAAEKNARDAIAALPDVLPGTTDSSALGRNVRGISEMAGSLPLIVNPVGAAVLAASTYGGTVAGAKDAADAAREQADQFEKSNPELAAKFRDLADRMDSDARIHGALSGATMAFAGRLLPEANGFLGRTALTAGEFAGINTAQEALNAKYHGKEFDPMAVLDGIVAGALTGAVHAGVSPKETQTRSTGDTEAPQAPADQVLVPGSENAPQTDSGASEPIPAQQPVEPPAPQTGLQSAPPAPPPVDASPQAKAAFVSEMRNREIAAKVAGNVSTKAAATAANIPTIQAAKDVAIAFGDQHAADTLAQVEAMKKSQLAAEVRQQPQPEPTPPNAQEHINADLGNQANVNAQEVIPPATAAVVSPEAPAVESTTSPPNDQTPVSPEAGTASAAPEKAPQENASVEPRPPLNPETEIQLAHDPETQRRVAAGLDPIESVPQGTKAEWERAGRQRFLNGDAPAILNSLVEQRRTATPVEHFTLMHYAGALDAEMKAAQAAIADPASTPEQREQAGQRLDDALNKRENLAVVDWQARSRAGAQLGVLAMRLERSKVPTLDEMLASRAKDKDPTYQTPLSETERKEVLKRHDEIQKKSQELAGETDRASIEASDKQNAQLVKELQTELAQSKKEIEQLKKAPAKGEAKPRFTKRVVDSISVKADAARARLRERGVQFNSLPDPSALPDYAIIMAEYIAKGVDAAAEMVSRFGESIKGSLEDIQKMARDMLANEVRLKTPDEIKQSLRDARATDATRTIGKNFLTNLAKAHIREALENNQKLTARELDAKVWADAKEFEPAITLQESRDLRTGYGKTSFPSDEPEDIALRDLNRQSQLLSSLERAEKILAPLKSGPQRDKASAEVRRLQKLLNAEMAKHDILTNSPEQLSSRRDAIVTRLKNDIEDLNNQIAGIQNADPELRPVEYDQELTALRDHRDRLQKIVDEMPENKAASEKAKDDAAIAVALKAEKEWNRRADELDFRSKLPAEQRGPAVEAARAKANEARRRYQDLKKASEANQPADYFEEISRKVEASDKRIAELEKRLATGEVTKDTKVPSASHPLLDEKRAQIERLNKEVRDKEAAVAKPERDAERLQNQLDDAQSRVLQLEERLMYGDLESRKTERPRVTAELQSLRDQIKGLNRGIQKARADADKPRREAEQARKALDDAIAENDALAKRLASGDIAPKKQQQRAVSDELKTEREIRKGLNKRLQELRKEARDSHTPERPPKLTEDQANRKRLLESIQRRTGELRQRRLSENYQSRTRQPFDPGADKRIQEAAFQLDQELRGYNEDRVKAQMRARSLPGKILGTAGEVLNTSRAVMTSFDASAVLRQGGFIALGNPIRAARAFPDMFRAITKRGEHRAQQDLQARENYQNGTYKKAGLYLAEESSSLSKMEEAYMSRFARKIPGVGLSERLYTTFLNRLRADSFDTLVNSLTANGRATPEEMKAIANYVNVATGRADMGKYAQAAVVLNHAFFSPRYVASRFQLLAGQPFYRGSARTRTLIAKEYAKFLIGASVIYGLSQFMGRDDLVTDPTSSDFLKVKIGDTRLDPLGGLIQATVFLSREGEALKRFATQSTEKPPKYGTGGDVLFRFLRSKLSPTLGAVVDALNQKDIVGQKVTPETVAKRALVPMSVNDVMEAMQTEGIPNEVILSILAVFGMGVQNYQQKTK